MAELPDLGRHCALQICGRLDYTPHLCKQCEQFFCSGSHHRLSHGCATTSNIWDGTSKLTDAIPVKPFVCSLTGCHQAESVKICCQNCGLNYCLRHRHDDDHHCAKGPTHQQLAAEKIEQLKKKLNIPDTAQSVVCEVEKPKKILTDAERQRMEKIETMKCKSSTKGHDIQQADIRFLHVEATGNAQGKFVLVDKKWTVSRCVDTTIRHFALVNTGSDAWAKKYQLYKDGQREPLSPSEEIGKLIDFNKNNVSYVQLKLDQ